MPAARRRGVAREAVARPAPRLEAAPARAPPWASRLARRSGGGHVVELPPRLLRGSVRCRLTVVGSRLPWSLISAGMGRSLARSDRLGRCAPARSRRSRRVSAVEACCASSCRERPARWCVWPGSCPRARTVRGRDGTGTGMVSGSGAAAAGPRRRGRGSREAVPRARASPWCWCRAHPARSGARAETRPPTGAASPGGTGVGERRRRRVRQLGSAGRAQEAARRARNLRGRCRPSSRCAGSVEHGRPGWWSATTS